MDSGSARIVLAAGAAGALLLAIALHGPLGTAWDDFKNEKPPPSTGGTVRFTSLGSARYDVWTAATDAFQAHPLDGIGPGAFEFYWSRHGTADFVRDAHSLYLEQAAELGLPGLLALLVALGGLLAAAIQARTRWRRRRELAAGSALIAAFIVFLAYAGVDWMWELGGIGTLAIGGIAVAAAGGFDRYGEPPLRPWARWALVAVAVAAALSQVPGLVSTERVRASQNELVAGNPVRAKEIADEAVDAEPWASSPYAARSLALEAAGDLPGARSAAQDAIDRDPYNWRDHLLMARIEARLGNRRGVEAQLRAARRLAPRSLYLLPAGPFRQQLDELLARRQVSSKG